MPAPETGMGVGRKKTGDFGGGKCALGKGIKYCMTEKSIIKKKKPTIL